MGRKKVTPQLRPHRGPNGKLYARLRIDGQDESFGPWPPTAAEQRRADARVAAWLLAHGGSVAPRPSHARTLAELLLQWSREAPQARGSDASAFRGVIRVADRERGTVPIDTFSLADFEAIVAAFARERTPRGTLWARVYCNRQAKRLRQILRWGRRKRLVPAAVLVDVADALPLAAGETEAPEVEVKEPPTDAVIDATLPHLNPTMAAMVMVQRVTGMRPAEVCRLRLDQLDRSGECWLYEPLRHKTRHHGVRRRIWIGPKGQGLLRPWVERAERAGAVPAWVFPPHQRTRPGQGHYDVRSYRRAVADTCARHGLPHWSPSLMRHKRLTEIAQTDPLAAMATASHTSLRTLAQHYLRERDEQAQRAAREGG